MGVRMCEHAPPPQWRRESRAGEGGGCCVSTCMHTFVFCVCEVGWSCESENDSLPGGRWKDRGAAGGGRGGVGRGWWWMVGRGMREGEERDFSPLLPSVHRQWYMSTDGWNDSSKGQMCLSFPELPPSFIPPNIFKTILLFSFLFFNPIFMCPTEQFYLPASLCKWVTEVLPPLASGASIVPRSIKCSYSWWWSTWPGRRSFFWENEPSCLKTLGNVCYLRKKKSLLYISPLAFHIQVLSLGSKPQSLNLGNVPSDTAGCFFHNMFY